MIGTIVTIGTRQYKVTIVLEADPVKFPNAHADMIARGWDGAHYGLEPAKRGGHTYCAFRSAKTGQFVITGKI